MHYVVDVLADDFDRILVAEQSQQLGITVRTVETHRAKIMLKLGFHSMADLIHYAIRNELVPEKEPGKVLVSFPRC
jgi:FixJ family two-component response regulator